MFSGFPFAHGRGVWGISHITTPPSLLLSIPPLVPVLMHICFTAAQGTESSHEFQDRCRS